MRFLFLIMLFTVFINVKLLQAGNGIGDTIHVVHYNIHLSEINTNNQTITAFTQLAVQPKLNGLQTIPLELQKLTVDSVLIGGIRHTFIQQDNFLRIALLETAGTDDTLNIGIYYHGQPFHESWGGFHFSGEYAFNLGVGFQSIPHNLGKTWFPCVDDFTDRATYDFFVTVNNDKKAICGGTLMDTIDNGNGTKTWHWQINRPIPTYLASVATGNYLLYADEYFGIEDTIPIRIYTRPEQIDLVEGSFVHLKEILQWYEQKFGPYPFSKVGYTGTAIGAMEHVGNIAYPHSSINGNTASESLLTHELAHMWFGDQVTCSTAEDMWLNEGWATFCEISYLEEIYGYDDFISTMRHAHREMLRRTHRVDGGYFALNNIPQEYTYGSHAYDKGGSVTHALRGYLGDSVFFDAVAAYLEHFTYESVSSEDMRDFLTDHTGTDMTSFFNAWVMTHGTPHFSIDSTTITESGSQYRADIWLKQNYKGANYLAQDNIIEVTFVDEHFSFFTDTVHFSGKTGHSVKYLDAEPLAVLPDLFEKSGDATTDHYRYFTGPEEYTFPDTYFHLIVDALDDSALVRATHNWVAPDSLKTQIEGLRLSPYRHWKVEGLWPETMQARGRFHYDFSNYLDDGLILSDNDSVVILYREGPQSDWEPIPQMRFGIWNVGYITTDVLKKGEYTLAAWDRIILNTDEADGHGIVNIWPNPSREKLNFEFAESGKYQIKVYDAKGTIVDQFSINGRSGSWKWNDAGPASGVVFIRVYAGRQLLALRKVVLSQ